MESRRLILRIAAIGFIIASLVGGIAYVYSFSSMGTINGPTVLTASFIGSGSPIQALGITITGVANTQDAYTSGPPTNAAGVPSRVVDPTRLQLSIGRGTLSNGTVAVIVTLTNIGRVEENVTRLTIGSIDASSTNLIESYVIGCTRALVVLRSPVINVFSAGNATITGISTMTTVALVTPTQNSTIASVTTRVITSTFTTVSMVFSTATSMETITSTCSQLAVQGPTSLAPGQSVSAFVLASPAEVRSSVSIGAGATFTPSGNDTAYQIATSFTP